MAAAAAGALDSGVFFASRLRLVREKPARAAGIVGGLGLWAALTASAARDRRAARTRVLAATNLAAQSAVLAVHLRHHVAGPRVWLGAGLAAAALAGAL